MATTMSADRRSIGQFIGGDVGRRRGRSDVRGPRSVHAATSSRRSRPPARARTRGAPIEAAAAAFPAWSQTPPAARQRDLPQGRRRPRAPRGTRSSSCSRARPGCTLRLRDVPDALRARACFRQAAAIAVRADRAGASRPTYRARSRWGCGRPVGVVGAIAPWNAALILSARSIAAPLALGNTVVLKPSEWSPVVGGLIWGEIFAEAGLPAGVLNIVTHAPGEAGADRRRARRASGRAADQLHGLDRDRAQARRGGRPQPEAGRARARRLQPADRARRRRPRVRGQRVGLRRVPPPGADLHVARQDHRRAARSPTSSSSGSPRRRRRSRPATRRSTTRSSAR